MNRNSAEGFEVFVPPIPDSELLTMIGSTLETLHRMIGSSTHIPVESRNLFLGYIEGEKARYGLSTVVAERERRVALEYTQSRCAGILARTSLTPAEQEERILGEWRLHYAQYRKEKKEEE